MIKNKIAKAAIAAALAIGGVVGVSQSASATDEYDCIPGACSGYYKSTDGNHGAWLNGAVQWYGTAGVAVRVTLYDKAADGRGPIAYIKYSSFAGSETKVRHLTTGGSEYYPVSFDKIITDSSKIEIMVCNGYGADGKADYCTGWLGGFHQY